MAYGTVSTSDPQVRATRAFKISSMVSQHNDVSMVAGENVVQSTFA